MKTCTSNPALEGGDRWVSEFEGEPVLQSKFQDSLGYVEKPCLGKQKIKKYSAPGRLRQERKITN